MAASTYSVVFTPPEKALSKQEKLPGAEDINGTMTLAPATNMFLSFFWMMTWIS